MNTNVRTKRSTMKKIALAFIFALAGTIALCFVSLAPAADRAKEIARDGRFVAYDNGTVVDTETGLMWASKDDGKGLNEKDAVDYCENYRGGGYTDWRMPSLEELETIFDPLTRNKSGYHVTKLIDITAELVWGSESPGKASVFNFVDGSKGTAFYEGPGSGTWYKADKDGAVITRALPVRGKAKKRVARKAKEIGRDAQFIAYENGTVVDTENDLMWASKDDGKGMTFKEARAYFDNYGGGGYTDWRIPNIKELETIYDLYTENRHGFRVTELIDITGERVWALDKFGEASGFSFVDGKWVAYTSLGPSERNLLALPVRSSSRPKIHRIELRDVPNEAFLETHLEEMIEAHNFFEKSLNKAGDFPNDLVDNGDGTITDRVTGLIWEKGGSSSALFYRAAEKYVALLNEEEHGGYDDWRIPTTEELASLLEGKKNKAALYMSSLFEPTQEECWSSDRSASSRGSGIANRTVNFRDGTIDSRVAKHGSLGIDRSFIKAVRNMEKRETAYISKPVKKPKIIGVKLRSDPKEMWDDDIEEMLKKYNFFAKYKNDGGSFPNDFVDNGDGTITDRTTGLMWEAGGSSSEVLYFKAQHRIKRLNKKKYMGYEDWRIPTLEELSSLLEPKKNEKGQHINALFNPKQKTCWSSDRHTGPNRFFYYTVEFSHGKVSWAVVPRRSRFAEEGYHYVRAVRSVVKKPKIIRVKLRSDPNSDLWDDDIEEMIKKHNFFAKDKNDGGSFPNDFVDNRDGTITDRVTGLMWDKGGSSSAVKYITAERLVRRLNKEKYLGYQDWRIPTLEELCSLLEPKINEKGQHINALFKPKQKTCWSSDRHSTMFRYFYHLVDFSEGKVSWGLVGIEGQQIAEGEGYHYVRAVRSVK
jgi:hypothetical protein